MPNADNINRLIAAIRAEEIAGLKFHFAMQRWLTDLNVLRTVPTRDMTDGEYGTLVATPNDCGTACCIAGLIALIVDKDHAFRLANDHGVVEYGQGKSNLIPMGQAFLEITASQAIELFIPEGIDLDNLTRDEAIRTLENLRDFDVVNWQHACRQLDKLEKMEVPPSSGEFGSGFEPDEMDEDGRHMVDSFDE